MQHSIPILCVDGVVVNDTGMVLMTQRGIGPYKGFWHLPGGHVHFKETVEEAAIRVVREETGIVTSIHKLIGIYSKPERDPRGHLVTSAFLLTPLTGDIKLDINTVDAHYFRKLPDRIGFDAQEIIEDGLRLWQRIEPL